MFPQPLEFENLRAQLSRPPVLWLLILSTSSTFASGADSAKVAAVPINESAKLTASDAAISDIFGDSVAVSGNTVLIAAPFDNCPPHDLGNCGSVYVFKKPASGWAGSLTESAKLVAGDADSGDRFGFSVALSQDVVVVGAGGDVCPFAVNCGAVYVFVEPHSGWAGTQTHNAKLTTSEVQPGHFFGGAVAISGDTLVGGAAGVGCAAGNACGSAYVFVRPAAGWSGALTETAKLTASDAEQGLNLGSSVAVDGDTIVVGAYYGSCDAGFGCGAAYVYEKPIGGWSGTLTEVAKLTGSDSAVNERFAWSLSIAGDTIVAGAPFQDCDAGVECGSAYVFEKPTDGWAGTLNENAKLTASDAFEYDTLGLSLSSFQDAIAIGALGDDCTAGVACGAAYLFEKPWNGWSGVLAEAAKMTATDADESDRLGESVSMVHDAIVAGAHGDNCDDGASCGSAYVFANTPPVANAGPDQTLPVVPGETALVTLDGSASFDPDGDPLTFSWTNSFGTVMGEMPVVALPEGTHLITLSARDDKGRRSIDTVLIAVGDPDLAIDSLSGPSAGIIGASITVSAAIENVAVTSSGPFHVAFYFSVDGTLDAGDTRSISTCSVPGLAAGSIDNTTCTDLAVSVPTSLTGGSYTLFANVDDLEAITESDETNNSRAADSGSLTVDGTCLAELVRTNETLAGTQVLQASEAATLGPNLFIDGDIVVDAPTVSILSGTAISGTFSIGTNPSCP